LARDFKRSNTTLTIIFSADMMFALDPCWRRGALFAPNIAERSIYFLPSAPRQPPSAGDYSQLTSLVQEYLSGIRCG
jgi:hypothetical protein